MLGGIIYAGGVAMSSELLSKKQRRVLEVIDRFGVLSMKQLAEYLEGEISSPTVYAFRKTGVNIGFIRYEKIGIHGMVSIAPRGSHYLDSKLPTITKVNYRELNHTLQMNNVLLVYMKHARKNGKEYSFTTERELRKAFLDSLPSDDRKKSKVLNQVPNRIPDFVWEEDGLKMACEVELNSKSRSRYERKFELYKNALSDGIYTHIRYIFKNEEILNKVMSVAEQVNMSPQNLQFEPLENVIGHVE
jgi:hypothetical protein